MSVRISAKIGVTVIDTYMSVSGDGVVDIDEREAAQERELVSQPRGLLKTTYLEDTHQVHYLHLVVSLVHLLDLRYLSRGLLKPTYSCTNSTL